MMCNMAQPLQGPCNGPTSSPSPSSEEGRPGAAGTKNKKSSLISEKRRIFAAELHFTIGAK